MQEYLRLLGRNAWVINLDPANEVPGNRQLTKGITSTPNTYNAENELPYDVLLDVCESVVNLSSVMRQLNLGPNGGLVYCMEYLEAHVDEIVEMIEERILQESEDVENENNSMYILLDLPGQVELYTHGNSVQKLLQRIIKVLDLRLVAVQLIDSHYCTEPANFLSAALLGTTTMIKLELPAVNVLSKVDMLANYGPLPFSLDFFTECQDLDRLLPYLRQPHGDFASTNHHQEEEDYDFHIGPPTDDYYFHDNIDGDYADDPDYQLARKTTLSSPFFQKHERLHKALAEVVGEFGLISFLPLDISSAESVGRVLATIDKCNGYIFTHQNNPTAASYSSGGGGGGGGQINNGAEDLFQCAVQSEPSNYECIADIQERISMAREKQLQR
jgi:hypothetical protein